MKKRISNFSYLNQVLGIATLLLVWACEPSRPALESYRLEKGPVRTEEVVRKELTQFAREQIGNRYKSAGKDQRGFDCSGLVIYVFRSFKIPMAASSQEQSKGLDTIGLKNARPGDLLFFGSGDRITHVGIISQVKDKQVKLIHSTSSRGVIEEDIMRSDYWVRRIKKVVSLESYLRSTSISSI